MIEMDNNRKTAKATREYFWSILGLQEHTICIPRIQRDYAQGRVEDEPTQIRKKFLADIFGALIDNKGMDINFIYGNTNIIDVGNQKIKQFIPIDGQQRLTTLFLIHWYFGKWSGMLDEGNKKILERFQYETRTVAGKFCNRLVNEVDIDLRNIPASTKDKHILIDNIKDYYWFFSDYENDATIKSMLVMLQEIHDIVQNMDDKTIVDQFFAKLISDKCPITFLFLNINDIGLTDEIYIKMNARGKALTRFENFKAQLSAYLDTKDSMFAKDFIGHINGDWSQFFWHSEYRPFIESPDDKKNQVKSNVFDDQIMALFKFVMFNEYITNVVIDDSNTETKYLLRRILTALDEENDFTFTNHLFNDEFAELPQYKAKTGNVDDRAFHFLYTLLNVLAKRKKDTGTLKFLDDSIYQKRYMDEEYNFMRLIGAINKRNLSYEEKIQLYAEFCFIVKYCNSDYSFDKEEELTDWIRIIYNLSQNTLYNGYDDYFRSIRRVRSIVDSNNALNSISYISLMCRKDYKGGSGFGFVENQAAEEAIKANLILKSDKWKKAIINAENSFLDSQISAIIAFSGIYDLYDCDMKTFEEANENAHQMPSNATVLGQLDLDSSFENAFNTYLIKFNKLFDKECIKAEFEEESLLRRALLTYGGKNSYLLPAGRPVCCFLDATDRDNSFRRLFRGDNNNKGARDYFKQLLDSIDENKDIKAQLQQLILRASYDASSEWKRYFIEMPEILDSMKANGDSKKDPSDKFVFLNPKRFIYHDGNDRILLLEKTMTSSINREYYSYVLYLKSCKKHSGIKYFTNSNENTEKYVVFVDKNDVENHILYLKDDSITNGVASFVSRVNGASTIIGDMQQALDYIDNNIKTP